MRLRKTKLIATIGPACDSPDILKAMIEAGMNVARLNFSHGTLEEHRVRLASVRKAISDLGANVSTMVDTRGVEIRTGRLEGGAVVLVAGQRYSLHTRPGKGDGEGVSVNFEGLAQVLTLGQRVLVDDGKIELSVDRIDEDVIHCRVECGGTLRDRKGVNLPDTELDHQPIDPETHTDLVFAAAEGVDYLAASFVQSARDVADIQRFLAQRGSEIPVIAKIETRGGVAHLESIVEQANGTMVARGDLGVELPMAQVPMIQKRIIRTTVSQGKPVITATQMLDSMERNPRPTRAEVSDVANAILDGTSAVMLSGETAAGLHPVDAVETMARLTLEAEDGLEEFGALQHIHPNPSNQVVEAVSQAAITMANHLDAAAIIALTESGFTARSISKYRPKSPILAVTPSPSVLRRLSMNWGVMPILYEGEEGEVDETRIAFTVNRARAQGYVREGDVVVVTAGRSQKTGGTDMIQVLRV
ncbi:MAG: pyruvate kinase [Deltaproteobacteria bacterium]|nr:pyruvate kinase [Deltaproteobacteria bacterium]